MSVRILFGICLVVAAFGPRLPAAQTPDHEFPNRAAISSAEGLVGRLVETRDGEELGRVRDVAIDLASGRIGYVVVAVGSFLIEDSLIAVAPGALRESAEVDGPLVLETDAASLRNARRFAGDDWPLRADVLPTGNSGRAAPGDATDTTGTAAAPARGSAVISDGTRTATLSDGERSIRDAKPDDVQRAGPNPR
jgi:sporulation protein YlmC with PRC-barrel domain